MHLVLFDTNNRTCGPCSAAVRRALTTKQEAWLPIKFLDYETRVDDAEPEHHGNMRMLFGVFFIYKVLHPESEVVLNTDLNYPKLQPCFHLDTVRGPV
jgi:hypothetical protein